MPRVGCFFSVLFAARVVWQEDTTDVDSSLDGVLYYFVPGALVSGVGSWWFGLGARHSCVMWISCPARSL